MYVLMNKDRLITISDMCQDAYMEFFLLLAVYFLLKNHFFLSIMFFNMALGFKAAGVLWLPGYLLVMAKKRNLLWPLLFFFYTAVF